MRILWLLPCVVLIVGCDGAGGSGDRASGKRETDSAEDKSPAGPGRRSSSGFEVSANAYPDIPAAIAALSSAAESNDGTEILKACTWLKLRGGEAVQPLGELLLNPSAPAKARYHACRALSEIGEASVPLLIKMLDNESLELRIGALNGLGRIKSKDAATNDRIAEALLKRARQRAASADTRRFALRALASLGQPAANVAKEPLIEMLHDPQEDGMIKGETRKALDAIAPRRTFVD